MSRFEHTNPVFVFQGFGDSHRDGYPGSGYFSLGAKFNRTGGGFRIRIGSTRQ